MPLYRALSKYKVYSYVGSSIVQNLTAQTSFSLQHSLEANRLTLGKIYRVTGRGNYSSAAAGQGNLEVRLKLNNVTLATTTSFLMTASVSSARMWEATATFTITGTGPSGSHETTGRAAFNNINAVAANSAEFKSFPASAIDTTIANTLSFSAQFTVADAANTISQRQLIVEELGD